MRCPDGSIRAWSPPWRSAGGLPLARRLGSNARLGRILFAGLILVVAAYVAVRALLVL
nr:hypothetical protein [Brevundimonas sp. SPF441]